MMTIKRSAIHAWEEIPICRGDFIWPCSGDPEDPESFFGDFLAQINFKDLPPLPSRSPLPDSGIFYLFAQEIGCAADPVYLDGFYFDGKLSQLKRTPHPDPERAWNEDELILQPVRIRTVPYVSLPWHQKAFRRVFTGDNRFEQQIALLTALLREGQIGQLLGFANAADEQINLYRQLFLGQIGKRDLMFSDYWDSMEEYEACIKEYQEQGEMGYAATYESMRPEVTWLTANGRMIAEGAAQWRLLIQIESNNEMNFWVNDADPLYTFIRDADLSRRVFSDLAGEVTQG